MRKVLFIFAFVPLILGVAACKSQDESAAEKLAGRIVPSYAGNIVFKQINTSADQYEFVTRRGKLIIKGNNSGSMATGLNRYLKEFCLCEVSWSSDDPIVVPQQMPQVSKPQKGQAIVKDRFFLNYCTYGYSMPYWKWNEWERLIDWMALNGINMAFATSGQESVWYEVWSELGLSHEQIMDYFTGPAHLPWHRLNNVDHFQGNLPQAWMDGQSELQKQIVSRERELGIKPVFQVFSGHAPEALLQYYPSAKLHPLHQIGEDWGGLSAKDYGSWFLETTDPLFAKIQKLYIEKSTAMYGTDHIYGADPFNEVDAPDWSPEFLSSVAKGIYDTMLEADPQARWLQMTWLFYADKNHWSQDNIKAYLTAVPQGGLTLLDYFCDSQELWKSTESFYGQPYIWCLLENFGGNTALIGNFQSIKEKIDNVLANGGSNFNGLGATMEALDCNMWLFEYLFERAWSTDSQTDPLDAVADRTLGRQDQAWRSIWYEMVKNIYNCDPSGGRQGTFLTVRPGAISNAGAHYNNITAVTLWKQMLELDPSEGDSYNFWLVNMGREALGNHFNDLYYDFQQACENRDVKTMMALRDQMLSLAHDMDILLSQHPYFSFGKWCDRARAWGTNKAEADYYEINARTLVTTWGTRDIALLDYANRAWAGLVESFHLKRWQIYLDAAVAQCSQGRYFRPGTAAFKKTQEQLADFEIAFASSVEPFKRVKASSASEVSKQLCEKWFSDYTMRQPRYSDLFNQWANTYRYKGIVSGVSFVPKAIFIGDSITEMWAMHPDFFAEHNSLYLGISGQTSSQIAQRFRTDVLPLCPEKVVILCGTNDIAGNDAPYNREMTLGNIRTMCNMALAKGITPVLCSVTPCDLFFWNMAAGDPSQKIIDLNSGIRTLASQMGLVYVDYHKVLSNTKGAMKEEYTIDHCHLNSLGYEQMEKIISHIISTN